jgi:tRNA pseudouridine38-40 synthase
MNDVLPASIRILEITEKPPAFHARKSAQAKTYRYRIYRSAICSPFLSRYVWHYPYPLNTEAMARAAAFVIGEHDFTSFAAVDPERTGLDRSCLDRSSFNQPSLGPSTDARFESNVRRVFDSSWTQEDDELIYTVRGSGFLHHMVRNLVGTFLRVGKGTLEPEDISRVLQARNRAAAGATAPASGLYLVSVEY